MSTFYSSKGIFSVSISHKAKVIPTKQDSYVLKVSAVMIYIMQDKQGRKEKNCCFFWIPHSFLSLFPLAQYYPVHLRKGKSELPLTHAPGSAVCSLQCPQKLRNDVVTLIGSSCCGSYQWRQRGVPPIHTIQGQYSLTALLFGHFSLSSQFNPLS